LVKRDILVRKDATMDHIVAKSLIKNGNGRILKQTVDPKGCQIRNLEKDSMIFYKEI